MKRSMLLKLLSIIVLSAMLLSLAACGSQADNQKASSSISTTGSTSVEASSEDPFGKYTPMIEVTAARPFDSNVVKFTDGEDLENNRVEKQQFEDRLGIKVKYQWTVPPSQYDSKLVVAIASDDLPDLIGTNMKGFQLLSDSDKIMDITDVYNNYASYVLRELYSSNSIVLDSAKVKGKLMGLPSGGSIYDTPSVIWLRHDWLTKLNLPEPKTMDDIIKIMDAFVNQDPDGNSNNDTYGIGIDKSLGAALGFFNSYHAYPFNTNGAQMWIKDSNDNLTAGLTQPSVRTALLKLQELYKEGYIDKEFAVKDANKVYEDIAAGKIGLAYGPMWYPLLPLKNSTDKDPNADWRPYPLLSIDDNTASPAVTLGVNDFLVVNKKAKYPEAAIKIANIGLEEWAPAFVGDTEDPDVKKAQALSQELKDYYQPKGLASYWQYRLFTVTLPNKNLMSHRAVIDALDNNHPIISIYKDNYDQVSKYENGDKSQWSMATIFGHNGAYSVINNHYVDKSTLDEFYGSPTKTMTEKGSILLQKMNTVFTQIIMGQPIENYDSLVQEWHKTGGDEITREVNDWYKAK